MSWRGHKLITIQYLGVGIQGGRPGCDEVLGAPGRASEAKTTIWDERGKDGIRLTRFSRIL